MQSVVFVDTSILCNLVPVPGRDQDREYVQQELKLRLARREEFILPITTVVETGNFIAQLDNGGLRRSTAQRLADILRLICAGRAPWILHDVPWNRKFLEQLLDGADTQADYVTHAQNRIGTGDLCILTERHQYYQRTGVPAAIWTLDAGLNAYSILG
ncbi:hypothetical protein [Nocardia sp. NPDC051750]|uniref:hypothetical protein n=1 Tax=Nocardia sp. NPDC051750 TaxID=3364325 RepID=UPI0037A3DD6D